MLEKKHHVCDLESTETVKCSNDDLTDLGQNISWYNGNTVLKSSQEVEYESLASP